MVSTKKRMIDIKSLKCAKRKEQTKINTGARFIPDIPLLLSTPMQEPFVYYFILQVLLRWISQNHPSLGHRYIALLLAKSSKQQ
jgi:hypothetical protein